MDRRFIFERADWERMPELRVQDVEPIEKKNLLYPQVCMGEIRDGSGSFLGEVSCTYCMDENLYRDCRHYIIHKDGTVLWNWGDPYSSIIYCIKSLGTRFIEGYRYIYKNDMIWRRYLVNENKHGR